LQEERFRLLEAGKEHVDQEERELLLEITKEDQRRKAEAEKMKESAATKIQASWRGYSARREMENARLQQHEREIAAMKIQRFYRRQQARRQERIQQSAVLIQSYIRKFLAIRAFKRLKQRREQERMEQSAAIIIQACVRRFLAMRHYEVMKDERREQECQQRLEAVVILQSHWRRCLAQRHVQCLEKAAIKIQVSYAIFWCSLLTYQWV
jgi:N-acyl-D-aspartate/D-glutamate deacylase